MTFFILTLFDTIAAKTLRFSRSLSERQALKFFKLIFKAPGNLQTTYLLLQLNLSYNALIYYK